MTTAAATLATTTQGLPLTAAITVADDAAQLELTIGRRTVVVPMAETTVSLQGLRVGPAYVDAAAARQLDDLLTAWAEA
jgi:hypothetical protein